jgi:hypothetical protein
VGAFPLRNEPAPLLLYAIAVVVIGIFGVVAVRAVAADRALLRTGALIMFWSVAVPVGLTYVTYHQNGLTWQGRYGMPYTVGLFVVAAIALDRTNPPLSQPIVLVGTLTWGLAHVVGQVHVLGEQRSDTHLVAATGWWAPPTALIVLLALAAAAAWLGALRRQPEVTTSPLVQQLVH